MENAGKNLKHFCKICVRPSCSYSWVWSQKWNIFNDWLIVWLNVISIREECVIHVGNYYDGWWTSCRFHRQQIMYIMKWTAVVEFQEYHKRLEDVLIKSFGTCTWTGCDGYHFPTGFWVHIFPLLKIPLAHYTDRPTQPMFRKEIELLYRRMRGALTNGTVRDCSHVHVWYNDTTAATRLGWRRPMCEYTMSLIVMEQLTTACIEPSSRCWANLLVIYRSTYYTIYTDMFRLTCDTAHRSFLSYSCRATRTFRFQ